MSKEIEKFLELARKLPDGLRSDWDDTNHYELTTNSEDYWWLILYDCARHPTQEDPQNPCETERGKKLGLIMDIAEQAKKIEPILEKQLDDNE